MTDTSASNPTSNFSQPDYTIGQIILTDELDAAARPVRQLDNFRPDQIIICWLSTLGPEGVVGMRWYYELEFIFERFEQTQNNRSYIFLQSSLLKTLPEGAYRVEIYTTPDNLVQTLPFTVAQYKPEVNPLSSPPVGHQDIENTPFVAVPFAFDEVWTIGEKEWEINEVKVTFYNQDDIFINIVLKTDLNPGQLSDHQLTRISRPLARYALQNGYLEQAQALKIDEKQYPLDEAIYVTLVNQKAGIIPGLGQIPLRRIFFDPKDLI